MPRRPVQFAVSVLTSARILSNHAICRQTNFLVRELCACLRLATCALLTGFQLAFTHNQLGGSFYRTTTTTTGSECERQFFARCPSARLDNFRLACATPVGRRVSQARLLRVYIRARAGDAPTTPRDWARSTWGLAVRMGRFFIVIRHRWSSSSIPSSGPITLHCSRITDRLSVPVSALQTHEKPHDVRAFEGHTSSKWRRRICGAAGLRALP